MYFVAHEIMSQTASEEDLVEQTSNWLDEDNPDEIDTLMGCSRGLMTLIRETSTLASKVTSCLRSRNLTVAESRTFTMSRDVIERSLYALKQSLPPGIINSSDLVKIAETKRLAAILHLRERLSIIPMVHVSTASTTAQGDYKADLVISIISLISSLPDSSTLLWPLFVLGNTQLLEEDRRFVLERLDNIQRLRNLGSVRQARLMVEDVWKRSDLDSSTTKFWDRGRSSRSRAKLISLA